MSKVGELDVTIFLELLIAVAVVAAFVRYVRIPYTVALVIVGLGLALLPNTPQVELTPGIILTVFLPVLLFYGAYHLNFEDLRANLTPVTLLAIPGVVVTAVLAGAALHWVAGVDWAIALLFGTIVAATDPVAVLAVFGEVGAPRRLSTIVTAESLFNDGTALVFFTTMVGVVTGAAGGLNVGITIEQFALGVAGSLALGVAVGIVGTFVLGRIDDALLETTILLIIAYGGFLLADRLGISGPLETVTAGLLLGVRGRRVMSPTTRLQAGATWEFLDFLANSLLFLLVGLELRFLGEPDLAHLGTSVLTLLWPLVAVLLAVTVARALVVWVVAGILRWRGHPFPRGWRTVLTWAGLRGAVALAAALSLPLGLPERTLLLTLTFLVVLVTLLGQGFTIRPLVERLGLARKEGEQGQIAVETAIGRLRGLDATVHELAALRRAAVIDEHLADELAARLAERREQARMELETAYASEPTAHAQRERDAVQHLLHVRREAVREAAASGQISDGVLRELLSEIDHELDETTQALQHATSEANKGCANVRQNDRKQEK